MTRSIEPLLDFFLREKGEPVSANGVQQMALIRDAADNIQDTADKMIRISTPLQTGDLIDYRNERYMITSQIDRNEYSYRGRMRKCTHSIAFNFNGNVKWFSGIVEGKSFSIDKGKVVSMPEGMIAIILQDNADTRDIELSQRFYNTHQPFKVTGIDRTVKGILKLNCILDLISISDDIENNIADRWKYEAEHLTIQTTTIGTQTNGYSVSVSGNPTIKTGQSASYISHIYNNGIEVFDQSVLWSLRNQDSSTPIMGSVTASTGSSATVKVGNQFSYVNKYIVLSAVLTSDPTITIEKTIQIKSLF